MMKVERNNFSSLERIFKMAVGFVPTHVLIECRKLLAPDSEEVLSADERAAAASRVADELMGLKGYLRFGVHTETVGEKDTPDQSEQFLIREFSLSDEDHSEEDDEHIYVPSVTAQEFWETLPSFVHISFSLFLRAICTFSGREYKYDPAQRVDTVIYHDEKKFMTSKSSKWQRGRRIVSYLTEVFRTTQIQ